MNKIRKYFADKDPSITQYLGMPTRDDIPQFDAIGQNHGILTATMTNTGMIALINSSLVSVLSVILFHIVQQQETKFDPRDGWIVAMSLGFWVIAFVSQMTIQSKRLKKAEQKHSMARKTPIR